VTIANIVEETVSTPEEFVALMRRGSGNRATGATAMNDRSSRSHLIMSIRVVCRNLVSGVTVRSKLSLVDLAGSERVGKTGAEGERLKVGLLVVVDV
jgi:kinesin family protein C2/C3